MNHIDEEKMKTSVPLIHGAFLSFMLGAVINEVFIQRRLDRLVFLLFFNCQPIVFFVLGTLGSSLNDLHFIIYPTSPDDRSQGSHEGRQTIDPAAFIKKAKNMPTFT